MKYSEIAVPLPVRVVPQRDLFESLRAHSRNFFFGNICGLVLVLDIS